MRPFELRFVRDEQYVSLKFRLTFKSRHRDETTSDDISYTMYIDIHTFTSSSLSSLDIYGNITTDKLDTILTREIASAETWKTLQFAAKYDSREFRKFNAVKLPETVEINITIKNTIDRNYTQDMSIEWKLLYLPF